MKILFSIIVLFAIHNIAAQSFSAMNSVIGIPDSLSARELRIYKTHQITTSTELFRLHAVGDKSLKASKYHYRSDNNTFQTIPLESKEDIKLIWLELTRDIVHLPSIKDIRYKLAKSEIIKEDAEYVVSRTVGYVIDGIGYTAQIRIDQETNSFDFNNYQDYLKNFPEVDELLSYDHIIKTISKGFKIWND